MREKIVLGIIVVASVFVFFPTTKTYFSQDDWVFLSHVYKQPFSSAWRYYPEAFYRPIGQQLFFFLNSRFFGLNPFGYHLVALGIHAFNVFLLARILLRHSGASLRAIESHKNGVRTLSVLLLLSFYALHQIHLIAFNWL